MRPAIKSLFLFFFLAARSIASADAQVYNVESLEGTIEKIRLLYNEDHDILTISCLNKTIHVDDCTGVEDSTIILNKKFLKIVYRVRGGSGIHLLRTLVLSIRNKMLYQSIHITSLFHEEFIDFSKKVDTLNPVDIKSNYEVKLNLTGNGIKNYKLNISTHDEKRSRGHPSTDYNKHTHTILNFDINQNIFCNIVETLNKSFMVFDPKTGKRSHKFIKGKYPALLLGNFEYYHIKGEWYEKGGFNELSKYSY